MRNRGLLGGKLLLCVGKQPFEVDDLCFVFLQRLLRFCQSRNLRGDVVLSLGEVELDHAQSLLDRHEFVVAFPQFVPSDEHFFNELFHRVSFEHPFKGRSLIVG